jgi:hypothetical protein
MQYSLSPDEAKNQGIAFEGHVPDAVRASEMSDAGMKSFEHLIGIFEGSSPSEDDFLQGGKSEAKFLAFFEAARAEKLAAQLANHHTWQCPTLVWERGGNLADVTDFSADARAIYVPQTWKAVTWTRFREEIISGYDGDNLPVRRKFIAKELELVGMMRANGVEFLAGTDTPAGVHIFPGFSLHEELQRFGAAGFTPLQALQTATINPARFFGEEVRFGTVENRKSRGPGALARESSGGHHQHPANRSCSPERALSLAQGIRRTTGWSQSSRSSSVDLRR